MKLETFLQLPIAELRRLVHERGPKVCVFPINGTRRWFFLEHAERATGDFAASYLEISGRNHLDLYRLFFEHGIETLLTPIFGPDLLQRGAEYDALLADGLVLFAEQRAFIEFYDAYDVRVSVYGEAETYLAGTPYEGALAAYRRLAKRTAHHRTHQLFFGVCAHDATETVARIGVDFHAQHGRTPMKDEIIERYYGAPVAPVDIFIGFDRLAVFDMPLVSNGSEDLYFTVAPSPYLDERTLRAILYDHMYARQIDDSGYAPLTPQAWDAIGAFYRANAHAVLGLGRQAGGGRFWHPTPQVVWPTPDESDGVEGGS